MRYNIWWFNLFCIQRLTSQCMARREKKGKHCWLIIATRRFTCNFPSQRVCSRATCPNLSKINQRYYHHTNIAIQKQRDRMLKHCCRSIAGREAQECSYQMPSSADGESQPVILFDGWKINSCQIWFAVFISSDRSLLVLYIFWYVWRRDVSQWLYWLVLSQNIKPNICYPKYRDSI